MAISFIFLIMAAPAYSYDPPAPGYTFFGDASDAARAGDQLWVAAAS